jgi:NADH-quinone oxidoreductase subunit J
MVKYRVFILTLAFLAVLFASLSVTQWQQGQGEKQPYSYQPREGARNAESGIGNIGLQIFTTYFFPFEVLALVLTVALVGAVYVAKKDTVSGGS